MAASCRNCGGKIVFGVIRDKLGTFCSTACHDNFAHPGFCNSCIAATTPASANDNIKVIPFGFGFGFYGAEADRCNTCASVVRGQWLCILFIPVFRVGKFRVKYVAPNRFLSRELPKQPNA